MTSLGKRVTMASIIAVAIPFLAFLNGSCFWRKSKTSIASVKFVFNLPIIKPDGSIMNVKDSISIFNQADKVVLKFFQTDIILENDTAVNAAKHPNYFAYQKG